MESDTRVSRITALKEQIAKQLSCWQSDFASEEQAIEYAEALAMLATQVAVNVVGQHRVSMDFRILDKAHDGRSEVGICKETGEACTIMFPPGWCSVTLEKNDSC